MERSRYAGLFQKGCAVVAALFGLLTVFAGTRVLTGEDPGYVVFRPLLIYNTVMGFMYILAGFLIWRSIRPGLHAAAAIVLLNLLVLVAVAYLYSAGQGVAADSVKAMLLRTGVWLALWLSLAWVGRRAS
ncbi:MAG: hypothetical protein HYX45_15170 [Burkholderiales bacterium]|nr:hypothetical protein [Burkholderiales bacterium]